MFRRMGKKIIIISINTEKLYIYTDELFSYVKCSEILLVGSKYKFFKGRADTMKTRRAFVKNRPYYAFQVLSIRFTI